MPGALRTGVEDAAWGGRGKGRLTFRSGALVAPPTGLVLLLSLYLEECLFLSLQWTKQHHVSRIVMATATSPLPLPLWQVCWRWGWRAHERDELC